MLTPLYFFSIGTMSSQFFPTPYYRVKHIFPSMGRQKGCEDVEQIGRDITV